MARRSGFTGLINTMAKEAARQARLAEAERKRQQRDAERRARERQRELVRMEKEAKQRYVESRMEEADDLNEDLAARVEELRGLLAYTLTVDDRISFDSLRIKETFRPFSPPSELERPAEQPRREDSMQGLKAPGWLGKLIPGAVKRYEAKVEAAEQTYAAAMESYRVAEEERQRQMDELRRAYEQDKQAFEMKVQQRNAEVDELETDYREGEREAVIAYNTMVLERSVYPDDCPQQFRVAYAPDSQELVIDYELPTGEIVPTVAEYRYVKTKDELAEKARKAQEVKGLYQDVVSAIALRTLHEVFEADQGDVLQIVVFNGYVHTVDPATGQDITPYLVSVRATKETFGQIDLSRVEKTVCLRNLGAQVSPRPTELQAVKPVVEFDMVDKRFVEHGEILEGLEGRPNLMDLNPYEFEMLVTNLFNKMGLEAKLTRSSKDGGVDSVAYDTRPIVGGKVVIQAKRYKHPVGVSAVRDLYGTMMNEGANKGILVTTSRYGPDAYDFAKDKPIELIDGGGLLYLLEQHGTQARIILPDAG